MDRLADGLAMVEMVFRAPRGYALFHEDELGRPVRRDAAVWQVVESLVGILVELDLFPSIWVDREKLGDHLGGRMPDWRGRERLGTEAALEQRWKKLKAEHTVFTNYIRVKSAREAADVPKAKSEALQQLLDWDIFEAEEDLARSLLRASLTALGVPAKKAADMVKGLPRQSKIDERRQHLTDFAVERLEFSDAKTARMRPTSAQLYRAYKEWCDAVGIENDLRFGSTAFGRMLAKSIPVQGHRYGSDGQRARGLSGIGLKPQGGKPGEGARRSRAEWRRWLSTDFAPALQAERDRLKKTA